MRFIIVSAVVNIAIRYDHWSNRRESIKIKSVLRYNKNVDKFYTFLRMKSVIVMCQLGRSNLLIRPHLARRLDIAILLNYAIRKVIAIIQSTSLNETANNKNAYFICILNYSRD